jgi:hypothetical protein
MGNVKEFSQQYFSGTFLRHPLEVARRAFELQQESQPQDAEASCATETSTKSVGTSSRQRTRKVGANYRSVWTEAEDSILLELMES